jgi:putative ABC transport system permease protein
MIALRCVIAYCRALFRRDVIADEIRDEMLFHIDMRAEEYRRGGMSAEAARRAAERRFGSLARMQDRGYDVRGGGVVETVLLDIRHAVRLFSKEPAFFAAAVATLAVGFGLSTTLFTIIDAAFVRPLPYPRPHELVALTVSHTEGDGTVSLDPSLHDLRTWRQLGRVFSHVGSGSDLVSRGEIVEAGDANRVRVGEVSEDFLEVFGVSPTLGRPVYAEDTKPGAPLVALLGHAYWRTGFGGDAGVIGRVIRLAGEPATVIGVLPSGFYDETAVWRPVRLSVEDRTSRGSGMPVIGRLGRGVTFETARQELTQLMRQPTTRSGLGEGRDVRVELTSMRDLETGGSGRILLVLSGGVALVLLIACVNVAGLLLARGAAREAEFAIRAAIGAGRARLVRQLLTESVVLSAAGAVVGATIAWMSRSFLIGVIPIALPPNTSLSLNLRVLAVTAGVSVASSVGIGILPAFRATRARLASTGHGHAAALSRRSGHWLVASEIALAVVLLVGAGLMVRSLQRLARVDVGFEPDAFFTLEVEPVDPAPAVRMQYYPALLDAIRRLPGVAAVGAVDSAPLASGLRYISLRDPRGGVAVREILPGYFETIGLRVVRGRPLNDSDQIAPASVALINQHAAMKLFAETVPVGQFLQVAGEAQPRRILGVVGDIRPRGPLSRPTAELYLPYGFRTPPLTALVRMRSSARFPAEGLRQVARTIGPHVVVNAVRSGSDALGRTVATPRRRTQLLVVLGGLGLVLAVVGIFSVTAYTVARRTREIGTRMALGAGAARVVFEVVADVGRPLVLGVFIGLGGAFYATRLISSFLFQTSPHDPATMAAVGTVVSVAAVLASWLPARRAARVDPVVALKAE